MLQFKKSTYARILILFGIVGLNILFINMSPTDNNNSVNFSEGAKGLKEPTAAQMIESRRKKVKKVKPNALAIERANEERARRGLAPLDVKPVQDNQDLEVEISDGTAEGLAAAAADSTGGIIAAYPAQVDNSVLPAFPPIGSQGGEGSCTAWATGYYQASHETCLVRGCDNKASGEHRASPRWIYNMINNGVDSGSYATEAFNLLNKNGYSNLTELPYTAGQYKKWDLTSSHWVTALSKKLVSYQTYPSVDTATGLESVKQALANGHIITFATYISSWSYGTISSVDSSNPSPLAGKNIVRFVNGTAGGHMMTIVGYDDSIWTDINNNGIVDSGEMGAIKIANSWGTGWGYSGFVWASYDSLKATTGITGGPVSTTRQPLFWSRAAYGQTAQPKYSPRLLAQFTVNTATRNQMYIRGGSSASNATTPSVFISSGAMYGQGGALAFDGSITPIDGTFTIDLTSTISTQGGVQNFYLSVVDSVTGSPIDIKNLTFIDPVNLRSIPYSSPQMPALVDGTTKYYYIGYDPSNGATPPSAVIYATLIKSAGSVEVQFDGTRSYDVDGSIVSYLWNFGDGTNSFAGATSTHIYTKAGTLTATLTVTDDKGLQNTALYLVNVPDTIAPSKPLNLAAALKTISTGKGRRATTTVVIDLTFSASSDNIAVTGYKVLRNGVDVTSTLTQVSATNYQDASAAVGVTYTYTVYAYDAAANNSLVSDSVSFQR